MKKNAWKRAARLVALAKKNPKRFRADWTRRMTSKLYEIHAVAGDLTADVGAFDIVDGEVNLLRQCSDNTHEIRDAKSILETEACRALRLNS